MSLRKESVRMSQIHSRRNRINDLQNLIPVAIEKGMSQMYWDLKSELSDLVMIQTAQKQVNRRAVHQRRASEGKRAYREWKQRNHEERLQRRQQTMTAV